MVLKDGPAAGTYMALRAPLYLRAVVGPKDDSDVLNELEDSPGPREWVSVYRQVSLSGQASIMLSRPRRCVRVSICEYVHMPDVDGQTLRDNDAWREWAQAHLEPLET